MVQESGLDVACYTAVMRFIIGFADEYVNVIEAFHPTNLGYE